MLAKDITSSAAKSNSHMTSVQKFLTKYENVLLVVFFSIVSVIAFWSFSQANLALAYNDARSHLNIARRVVEGLKPGLAQIGSVWLPLPHLVMLPTVGIDFFWHSGLSGALVSMISYVLTVLLINKFLQLLNIDWSARLLAMAIFAFNVNILYLQSTAMTELLLIVILTGAAYFLSKYQQNRNILTLIWSALLVMASTLTRYDGWFLLFVSFFVVMISTWSRSKSWTKTESYVFLFGSLAGLGILAWLIWNYLIFGDPLFFAFGPYSAHSQQLQLEGAGELPTKHNLWKSIYVYFYAMTFNSTLFFTIFGFVGSIFIYLDKNISRYLRFTILLTLYSILVFNIIALYLGHSVLFIQGISGNTWFNVRYGVMMVPSFAIFVGYFFHKFKNFRPYFLIIAIFVISVAFLRMDSVTIDDARVGSSQKNVSEVSSWLRQNAAVEEGFIMISAASHDAIIFSSGLPMKRFIHEGTGKYWLLAGSHPSQIARYIIMRTHDNNDSTFKLVNNSQELDRYDKIASYPFADIYRLKTDFESTLIKNEIFPNQK